MKNIWFKSALFGSISLLSAVHPALASYSFSTSTTQVLPVNISLAGAPLGNGGTGGGLYTVGGATFYFGGVAPGQGVVNGASGGQYAPPILTPTSNPTTSNYLSTGAGTILLTFSKPQTEFSLLWGSVDSSNALNFFNSPVPSVTSVSGPPVFSVTGSQVSSSANGNQGVGGSVYVTVAGPFNQISFVSPTPSFESANFASLATPEPGLIGMLGAGLAIHAAAMYRRRRTA